MRKPIALLLVSLMVMLPVVSAQALATLSITSFQGADRIRGITKSDDKLTIEALVSMPDDATITRDQFHILEGGSGGTEYIATDCKAETNATTKCTFTQNIVDGRGTVAYRFELRRDTGAVVEQTTETLKIDAEGADVTSLGTANRITNKNAKIRYVAEDTLGGSGDCSGVDKIELYVGTPKGNPIQTRSGSRSCSEDGEFADVTFSTTGEKDLCAIAYDRLGQTAGPRCFTVTIDDGPPKTARLNVTDADGFVLHYIPAGGMTADLIVTINSNDVVASSVRADLSAITKNEGDTDVPASSVLPGDDVTLAIWRNVNIKNAGGCQMKVTAEDDLGSESTKTLPCGLAEDNAVPRLTALTSPLSDTSVDNGTNATAYPVIGITGQVVASITESGSGLHKGNVYLDASDMGLSNLLRASNCTQQGDSWTCVWNVRPLRAHLVQLKVSPFSTDDVGNPFARDSLSPVTFLSDQAAPTGIEVVDVRSLHGGIDIGNHTVKGDIVEYKVKAGYFSTASADLSQLGGSNATPCERAGNVCTFTTPVERSGPYTASNTFTFTDAAGNKGTVSHSLSVLGISNETNPNFWSHTVTCSPSLIDRSITSLINVRVYCHIKLTPSTAGATTATVAFDPASCWGNVSQMADLGLSNTYAGSTEPILYLLLSQDSFRTNSITFTCPLSITTRIGDFISVNKESENVTTTLKFFSRPQEDIAKATMNKFDQAKKDALKLDGLIGTLKKLFEIAEKACTIRSTIINALSAIDSVMNLINFVQSGALNLKATGVPAVTGACSMFDRVIAPPGISGEFVNTLSRFTSSSTMGQPAPGSLASSTGLFSTSAAAIDPTNTANVQVSTKLTTPIAQGLLEAQTIAEKEAQQRQLEAIKKQLTSDKALPPGGKALTGVPLDNKADSLLKGMTACQLAKLKGTEQKAGDEKNKKEAQDAYAKVNTEEDAAFMLQSNRMNVCLGLGGICDTLRSTSLASFGATAPLLTQAETAFKLAQCPGACSYAAVNSLKKPCVETIDLYKKTRDAYHKVEDARKKFCTGKEGIAEKFKESIDCYLAPFCNFVNCDWGPAAGGEAGGIFQKFTNFMGTINPNNYLNIAGIGPGIPVKESLVWSVASLCLPGIINNVDKYRQINCEYALCIGRDVVQNGLPISACEKKKEELMCNFLWGQVFNSVPFVGTVEGWINQVKEMITNPIAAITFILGQYCKPFCNESRAGDRTGTMYKVCAFPKTLDAVAAVIKDIKGIIQPDFWKLGESQCDQLKNFNPTPLKKPGGVDSGQVGGGEVRSP